MLWSRIGVKTIAVPSRKSRLFMSRPKLFGWRRCHSWGIRAMANAIPG